MNLSLHDMIEFCTSAFEAVGLSHEHAGIVADNLVGADADGVRTHGFARLDAYLKAFERHAINAKPNFEWHRTGAVTRLAADNGPGPVVAHFAMIEAIDLARQNGIGLVSVSGSNHFGAAGHFAQMAAEAGMIGFAMSNASATVAPMGGGAPAFGTNPLAFGAPGGARDSFLLDMASSIASRGQLRLAQVQGGAIPSDWAVTAEGKPAQTADEALAGALFPFGGAKGYSIALMIEIMSSVLSGAASGRDVASMYGAEARPANVGHAFIAINIAALRPLEAFTAQYDRFATSIETTQPIAEGKPPRLPGRSKFASRAKAEVHGVSLSATVIADMRAISKRLQIALPASLQSEVAHGTA